MKKSKIKLLVWLFLSLILFSTCIGMSLSLASCTSDKPESLAPSTIINQIFPNIYVLVAQLIAGVILFCILLFLIWKPTSSLLERRQNYIDQEIQSAKIANETAQQKLTDAKAKAKTIIEQSYAISRSMIDSAKQEAKTKTEELISSTNDLLNREIVKMKNDAQQEMFETVFKATEFLLRKEISQEDNQKLVKDFIQGLNQSE